MAIVTKVETITPEQAREYLKANTANYRGQSMSRSRVRQYADDMKAGRWQLNGEAICFGENGILKNGQHRLAAIIMAGVPVQMTVTRGIDNSVTTYDLGYNRTLSQMVTGSGANVSTVMQCAANLLFYVKNGRYSSRAEVNEYIRKHEDELNRAWRCMLNGDATKNVRRASLGLAAYLMLMTGQMPFYELEVFFKVFSSGVARGTDGYEISPVIVARKMFDDRYAGTGGGQRAQREQLDIAIQAMNDLRHGRKRSNNYKISQPFAYEPLVKRLTV